MILVYITIGEITSVPRCSFAKKIKEVWAIKGFNRVYQTLIFSFTGLLEIFY